MYEFKRFKVESNSWSNIGQTSKIMQQLYSALVNVQAPEPHTILYYLS